ncbi:MAG: hypothetical protein ACM3NI_09340, partial [Bacteroidota bacterium]
DYALMHAHVQENPPSPKEFQRRLPPELESVILKAIEKDPARRFQSAAEFRTALFGLGLMERRNSVVDTFTEADRKTGHRAKRSQDRIWGGAWLDFSMLAMALLLALTLNLSSLRKPSDEYTAVEATHSPVVTRPKPAKTLVRQPITAAPDVVEADPPASKPPHDKYNALRQAWGG